MDADTITPDGETPNNNKSNNNTISNKAPMNTANKLAIIKKALIDERKQKEELQNNINEKNIQISKLQMQLDQAVQNLNNITLSNPNNNNNIEKNVIISNEQEILNLITEISQLKEELTQVKEENKSYQEQNIFLKQQLEVLSTEIDDLRNKNENTENTINAKVTSLLSTIEEQNTKLNLLQNLNKDLELKHYSYESTISSLQKELKQKQNEIDSQTQTNEALILSLQRFKQDIEIQSREYKQLQIEFELKREITVNELFKGRLIMMNNETVDTSKNRFEMFYGKYPEAIVMTFANREMIVKINDIYSIKYININEDDNNYNTNYKIKYKNLEIYFLNNTTKGTLGEELVLIVQFKERECEYIINFYKERNKKYKKIAYTDLFS